MQQAPPRTSQGTESSMNSLTLYDIESRLAELLDLRSIIEEDGMLDEPGRSQSLAAIDAEIEQYFLREVKKVDNIAAAIHAYIDAAEQVEDEIDRLENRRRALIATADRIKQSTLNAMQTHGIKRVETPTNVLRIQGNGGLAPLVIDDPEKIPDELCTVTVSMNADDWIRIVQEVEFRYTKKTCEPDGERIRAALKEGSVDGAHLAERGQHLRLS
jgi:hypothetical protein